MISLPKKVVDFLISIFGSGLAITDLLRVLIILPTFIYASYTDYKSRRVSDIVWIPAIIGGTFLFVYDLYTGVSSQLAPVFLTNFVFMTAVGFILYKTRVFYGADLKAFIVLGICLPSYPLLGNYPIIVPPDVSLYGIPVQFVALTVLVNTMLASAVYPLINLYKNIRKDNFSLSKPLRNLTVQKVPVYRLNKLHGHILEPNSTDDASGFMSKGVKFISASTGGLNAEFIRDYTKWAGVNNFSEVDNIHLEEFLNDNDEWESSNIEEDRKTLESIAQSDSVWITPGIPFIIPLTIGIGVTLYAGDILYGLIALLNTI